MHFTSKSECQLSSYKQDTEFEIRCFVNKHMCSICVSFNQILLILLIKLFINLLNQFILLAKINFVKEMAIPYFTLFENK